MNGKVTALYLTTIVALHAVSAGVPERYTTLLTIAGKGEQEDGNFWQTAFEDSNPLQVELSNPHSCGTDVFGRVYIVDKESHSILRVSADGSTITTVAGTHVEGNGSDSSALATDVQLRLPNGLHVFLDGSYLILDTDNQKVRHVTSNGVCSTLFSYPSGFGAGRGLVATPDGLTVYFCGEYLSGTTQLVKKWQEDEITTIASLPMGGRGLGNLDIAPDGALFVTSVGDHRVYRIIEGSAPEIIAGNGLEEGNIATGSQATQVALNRVRGIAILPDSSFFLATQKGGDIWWVDNGPQNDGLARRIHLFLNGADNGNVISGDGLSRIGSIDRISEPRAVHLATNGDLIITTNDTGVIRAIRNVCKPTLPKLSLADGKLTWTSLAHESSWLEHSTSLESNRWDLVSITERSEEEETLHSLDLPIESSKGFFRLQVPTLAGGQ
ncbi:MAG: hypothetical protein QNL33_11585 [Akkermansiaceae bacterium]|jgi:hypothetical protein